MNTLQISEAGVKLNDKVVSDGGAEAVANALGTKAEVELSQAQHDILRLHFFGDTGLFFVDRVENTYRYYLHANLGAQDEEWVVHSRKSRRTYEGIIFIGNSIGIEVQDGSMRVTIRGDNRPPSRKNIIEGIFAGHPADHGRIIDEVEGFFARPVKGAADDPEGSDDSLSAGFRVGKGGFLSRPPALAVYSGRRRWPNINYDSIAFRGPDAEFEITLWYSKKPSLRDYTNWRDEEFLSHFSVGYPPKVLDPGPQRDWNWRLKHCSGCKREISVFAKNCPACHHPNSLQLVWTVANIVGFFMAGIIFVLGVVTWSKLLMALGFVGLIGSVASGILRRILRSMFG